MFNSLIRVFFLQLFDRFITVLLFSVNNENIQEDYSLLMFPGFLTTILLCSTIYYMNKAIYKDFRVQVLTCIFKILKLG